MTSAVTTAGSIARAVEKVRADDAVRIASLEQSRYSSWNAYVRRHPQGSIFHTTEWKTAIESTFNHRPCYFLAERGGAITGVLPLFLVKSLLAGRLLVSVPYGVSGGVLADDEKSALALLEAAWALADSHRCRSIDIRSERALFPDIPIVDRYVGFRRELPAGAGEVLAWLPRKARAAARNGREKFRLSISYSDEHLTDVWRLYTHSMRRLASLNYPFRFFQSLVNEAPGHHWVSLVRWQGVPVAGLVTLCHGDCVMPYFLGTTNRARRCSATNFIYLDCMERAVAGGYRVFDFGRSRRVNAGSYNFKRFQGFEPRPLQYQIVVRDGQTAPNLSPDNPRFGLARKLWPRLPLVFTRRIGAALSAHVAG